MEQTLVLIRGLPGSGKSTLAQKMSGFTHLESDMFFLDVDGTYAFDPALIRQAHEWCQRETEAALGRGENTVVSNTFTQIWEMEPYFDLVSRLGIRLNVIEARGNFGSLHNVPAEKVEVMRNRWEPLPVRLINLAPPNC